MFSKLPYDLISIIISYCTMNYHDINKICEIADITNKRDKLFNISFIHQLSNKLKKNYIKYPNILYNILQNTDSILCCTLVNNIILGLNKNNYHIYNKNHFIYDKESQCRTTLVIYTCTRNYEKLLELLYTHFKKLYILSNNDNDNSQYAKIYLYNNKKKDNRYNNTYSLKKGIPLINIHVLENIDDYKTNIDLDFLKNSFNGKVVNIYNAQSIICKTSTLCNKNNNQCISNKIKSYEKYGYTIYGFHELFKKTLEQNVKNVIWLFDYIDRIDYFEWDKSSYTTQSLLDWLDENKEYVRTLNQQLIQDLYLHLLKIEVNININTKECIH